MDTLIQFNAIHLPMTSDPDNIKPDAEPQKEPWQVVGCPTCRAPPGMRCSSGRMSTHSTRKRLFFKKWEEEQVRLGKGKIVNGKFEFYTRKKPTFPVEKPARSEKSERTPGQLVRAPRKTRANPSSRDATPVSQKFAAKGSEQSPVKGRKEGHLPGGEDDWSALAAQLRADNKRSTPTPSPALPTPTGLTATESHRPRVPAAAIATARVVSPVVSASRTNAPFSPPLPPLPPLPPPPPPSPTSPVSGRPVQPAPAKPSSAPHFNLTAKREDPAVWKETLCPQCRAPAGVRCVGPLGDARFASHDARQKLHGVQSADGHGAGQH